MVEPDAHVINSTASDTPMAGLEVRSNDPSRHRGSRDQPTRPDGRRRSRKKQCPPEEGFKQPPPLPPSSVRCCVASVIIALGSACY